MSVFFRLLLAVFVMHVHVATAQIAIFDTATGWVDIPSVAVGGKVYIKVRLKDTGGLVFQLQAATLEQPNATPPIAHYDAATAVLDLPIVNAGAVNYHNVTLKNIGNYTFTVQSGTAVAALARIPAPPRWIETWSSADADPRTGTYTLSVVDPLAANTLMTVDTISVPDMALGSARVHGGTFDPISGQVIDPGVRHLAYTRGGKLYHVNLDRNSGTVPVPVQMTTETNALSAPILQAQSARGDDAVFRYTTGLGDRYVRLSATATTAPLQAATFPGDAQTTGLLGSIVDPDSGILLGLIWSSRTPNNSHRLFRTAADFSGPVSIGVYSTAISNVTGDSMARMMRGWTYVADGALRRYDFATHEVSVMLQNADLFGVALHDDDSLFIRTRQGAVQTLMRCVDARTASCVTLFSGAEVGTAETSVLSQNSTHVQITSIGGTATVSVRKADGAVTRLDFPSTDTVRQWAAGNGQAVGERLFYWRNNGTRSLVGSVKGDGSDRREFEGTPVTSAWALPARVAAHRLGYREHMSPYAKLLVRVGPAGNGSERLAWLDGSTGELSADLGSVPSSFFNTFSSFPVTEHPYPQMHGNISSVGLRRETVRQFQPTITVLDAFMIGVQAPAIVRLTNYAQ